MIMVEGLRTDVRQCIVLSLNTTEDLTKSKKSVSNVSIK